MGKYTMDDIAAFLVDYRNSQGLKPDELMISLPFVGKKMYEKAFLEDRKQSFFEREYLIAINRPIEEQQEFIEKMTPVLDSFYGVNDKNDFKSSK